MSGYYGNLISSLFLATIIATLGPCYSPRVAICNPLRSAASPVSPPISGSQTYLNVPYHSKLTPVYTKGVEYWLRGKRIFEKWLFFHLCALNYLGWNPEKSRTERLIAARTTHCCPLNGSQLGGRVLQRQVS